MVRLTFFVNCRSTVETVFPVPTKGNDNLFDIVLMQTDMFVVAATNLSHGVRV